MTMEVASDDVSLLKSAIVDKNLEKVQELLTQQSVKYDNKNVQDLLSTAVEIGSTDIVSLLIKHGFTITASENETSHPLLYYAIEAENLELVEVLLSAGASIITKYSNFKEIPLLQAFNLAVTRKNFKIVDLMLSAYNTENINIENQDEIVLFYIACIRNKTNLVERFIEKGINVSIFIDHELDEWTGSTALHYAVKYQSLEVVELLLEHKADVLSLDLNMQSPLHLAFMHLMNECNNEHTRDKAEEIIDLILSAHEGGDEIWNPIDTEFGVSHFHVACMRNNVSVVENYLQNGVDVNTSVNCKSNVVYTWCQNTALHFAATSHNKDIIKLLIEHGADVNAVNGCGLTPLWLLLENQPTYSKIRNLIRFCKIKDKTKSEEVKSQNPFVNHLLEEFKYIECIKLLVEAGSNLNYKDEYSKPLLFQVYDSTVNSFIDRQDVSGEHGKDEISNICTKYYLFILEKTLDIFKRNGVDFESRDAQANSILHNIAQSIHTNQVLCLALKAAEIIMSFGVNPNVENEKGEVPVIVACAFGSLEFVELLLKFNGDPSCVDRISNTLSDVVFNDHYEDDNIRSKMIDLLANYGANVNKKNADGETILFKVAKSSNYLSSMKSILEAGCCIDAQNKEGETALFVAVLQNDHQSTKLLLDYGADVNIKDISGKSLMEKLFLRNVYSDYINQTYQLVLEVLEMHIRKLKLTNTFVSHCNLVHCKRLKFAYEYQPHIGLVNDLFQDEKDLDIDVTDKDRNITSELNKVIAQMKAVKIDDDISLFHILFEKPEKISKYLKNKYFQKCMSDEILCSQFSRFQYWLIWKYKEGLVRCSYLDDALKSLKCIIGKNFPDACLYTISFYLSNSDLKSLINVNF